MNEFVKSKEEIMKKLKVGRPNKHNPFSTKEHDSFIFRKFNLKINKEITEFTEIIIPGFIPRSAGIFKSEKVQEFIKALDSKKMKYSYVN